MKQKNEKQKFDALKKETKPVKLSKEKPKKEIEKDVTKAPESPAITEKKRRHIRGIWAVTIIFIICVIFGGSVWYFVLFDSNTDAFSIVFSGDKKAEEEKKKEEEAKNGLKTYTNLSAFFSFDYPDSWALEEKSNTIYLSSDTSYPKSYLEGTMPEVKDTDIYIQIHFSNQEIGISREAPAIKPKFSNLNVGGVSTKRVTYKNEDIYSDIVQNFQAGDFYFLIIADTKSKNTDKIEAYNKMLSSFKFGKEVIEDTKK